MLPHLLDAAAPHHKAELKPAPAPASSAPSTRGVPSRTSGSVTPSTPPTLSASGDRITESGRSSPAPAPSVGSAAISLTHLYFEKIVPSKLSGAADLHRELASLAAAELTEPRKISGPTSYTKIRNTARSSELLKTLEKRTDEEIAGVLKILRESRELHNEQARARLTETPTGLSEALEYYRNKPEVFRKHAAQAAYIPVFTAHPSELRAPEGIAVQAEIAGAVREAAMASGSGPHTAMRTIVGLLERFTKVNGGKATRQTPPSATDEVRYFLDTFARSIFDGVLKHNADFDAAKKLALGASAPDVRPQFKVHSWIGGGDRDGNPNVTAKTTLETGRLMKKAAIERYRNDIGKILDELVRTKDQKTYSSFAAIDRKLENTLAPQAENIIDRYDHPGLLLNDLENALAGAENDAVANRVNRLRQLVDVFGMHLASLEYRQHSDYVLGPLAELARAHGIPVKLDVTAEPAAVDAQVKRILNHPAKLTAVDETKLSADARELLDSLRALKTLQTENGKEAVTELIVANTDGAAPILALQHLAREIGIKNVQVVPLFESIASLKNAPAITRDLLSDAAFRKHLGEVGNRFEMMVGYSDSAKDGGRFASDVYVRKAQVELAKACAEAGVQPEFFHGRGGTLARGYAEPEEAFAPLDPLIPAGKLKQTEQGELVYNRFGTAAGVAHYLNRCMAQAFRALAQEPRQRATEAVRIEQEMAESALASAQEIRQRDGYGPDVYHTLYPIGDLKTIPNSSRPVQRKEGGTSGSGIADMRAVGWNASPYLDGNGSHVWHGTGSALQAQIDRGQINDVKHAYDNDAHLRNSINRAKTAHDQTDITAMILNMREIPLAPGRDTAYANQFSHVVSVRHESDKMAEGLEALGLQPVQSGDHLNDARQRMILNALTADIRRRDNPLELRRELVAAKQALTGFTG